MIITDVLYRTHPDLPEGRLAKLRASVVNMHALAGVGRGIGLGEQLRLGRGEEMTGGRDKSSIVADAVEAVIGAVYLQYGLETAREVVHRLFADLLTAAPQLGAGLDWKTSLQELSAVRGLGVPEYRVSEEGPDHAKVFAAQVCVVGGRSRGEGIRPDQEGSRAERCGRRLHRPASTTRRLDGVVGMRPADQTVRRVRPTVQRPVPELPEVEVVRRGLTTHLIGRRISRVQVFTTAPCADIPAVPTTSGHPGRAPGHRRAAPGQVSVVGAG